MLYLKRKWAIIVREINLKDLKKRYNKKSDKIERKMLRLKANRSRPIRTKPRDYEESRILTKIFLRKFKKDLKEGKIIFLKDREWYYELPTDER
jgi:hypothetical protein